MNYGWIWQQLLLKFLFDPFKAATSKIRGRL